MCFSLEADLVAGAALLPVGALALREVRAARELPFAALPLVLATHQLVEAVVWAGVEGHVAAGPAHAAAVAYVVVALPLLPTLLPVAVLLLARPGRRRWVAPFLALGVVVTAHLARVVAENGVRVEAHPHALVYRIGLHDAELWTGLYVLATMGACLVAGHRVVVAFGLVNLVGLTVVAVAYREAFASLWCLYAALSSLLVLVHLALRPEVDPASAARDPQRSGV
ncbi:hypothetical protein QWY28_00920 [Nocardioides sp. SOB77]|uniref:Integral membrane protein n=1 Tax=Nocardioides oceani TaxID=3058369 RepID=A0ABT8F9Y0_9ACTN|nr:DUF6629 family protein [Nocardioides oceani]MDN4171496.1 hypothetical protein [Nocardioides oceani]